MKRPPKPVNMTLNLAPMVDVMMCLIIFFLLASKLVEAEHYQMDLPWAVAAERIEPAELGRRVTITVRAPRARGEEAEYIVVDWDGRQIVERVLRPAEIEPLLKLRKARADRDGQTLRCVVRADEMVKFEHVEVVLRGCGLARIKDVVFGARVGAEREAPA